jgi:N-acetylglucosaminyldiphosphoundecaprenol N-acetyl-beta-D-mannosaminyltransferase
VVERINGSGAGLMFIGLGCPKQDLFAYDHRATIRAVQVCVGAAFDFHAGVKPMAPAWMQRRGLEWLYRLIQEPGRLWRRYLVTNSVFLAKLGAALARRRRQEGKDR